jgi:hypothetical protein
MDAQVWDRISDSYFDEISTPFQANVINPLLDYLDALPAHATRRLATWVAESATFYRFSQDALKRSLPSISHRRGCAPLKKAAPMITCNFAGRVSRTCQCSKGSLMLPSQ